MSGSQMERARELVRQQGILRPRDLVARNLPGAYLGRLAQEGRVERVGRGLYRSRAVELTEQHTLAEVCRRVPQGVVCLLSALRFHNLTTQSPAEVWLALSNTARVPKLDLLPLRVVRFGTAARTVGVEEHLVEGVPVRVYDPAKTVVDCFKFRNKIGLEAALEALHASWRERRFTMDQIWRYAAICRMTNVMRPYLESLV
ncbi:MAG: transcriptional regulator [Chloroflexi bacterium HGW-Chloroflexi-1]|nr:MAG: transcriptional regulator [Chloroflexi bacterium HGW-Chloroflexi-1]